MNQPNRPTTRPLRWSVTTALAGGFGLLIAVAVSLVLFFGLRSAFQNTQELLAEKTVLIVDSVAIDVAEHVKPLGQQVGQLAAMAHAGELNTASEEGLAHALSAALSSAPVGQGLAWVSQSKRAIVAVRTDEGVRIDDASWADAPINLESGLSAPTWGSVISMASLGGPVLNVHMSTKTPANESAWFVASYPVKTLSQYLASLTESHRATPFVLVGHNSVLAHPELSRGVAFANAAGLALPTVIDLKDSVLAALWDERQTRDLPGVAERTPGFKARLARVEGRDYVIVHKWLFDASDVPLIVGCYFSVDNFQGLLDRLGHTAIAGTSVLVGALLLAWLIGRAIRRPIGRLADSARFLRQHGVRNVRPLPRTRLAELDTASRAFNEMVASLKEREDIRETFGKYVPDSVVDAILADRGVLRPQTREATVMFTDIVGYSTVSESMNPEEAISLLNDYFALVAEPIERFGGIIHQFQGDGILATFNLPVEDPDHATKAIRCALDIQARVAAHRFSVPSQSASFELGTRIGINTGEMVGGTVGTETRLGYTVHGDDVNLASRVEQLNKEYDTRVLVTGSTALAASAAFAFEQVGVASVRGRSQPVALFRVVGPADSSGAVVRR
ncbi:MAG: adenylate/guanylate cyclase domain-containing protein [Pseudomonadota bacterium]